MPSDTTNRPANPWHRRGDKLHPSKDQDARPWFASDDDQQSGDPAAPLEPAYRPARTESKESPEERAAREKDQP
ncbi:MAG: hypothetical protein ABW278_06745 [Steroidobacteraceae bacterium]